MTTPSYLKNLTFIFVIGILTGLFGTYYCLDKIFNSGSAADKLFAIYLLIFGFVPIVILIVIDRIFVKKFGVKKVNKIQGYILATLVISVLINWFRLQLQ